MEGHNLKQNGSKGNVETFGKRGNDFNRSWNGAKIVGRYRHESWIISILFLFKKPKLSLFVRYCSKMIKLRLFKKHDY